jgi:hypothetical protein
MAVIGVEDIAVARTVREWRVPVVVALLVGKEEEGEIGTTARESRAIYQSNCEQL